MNGLIKELVRFFRGHWLHVLIGFPGLIGFTILHESAHCAAVWALGGTVTEFVWLPSAGEWGHMRYEMQPGVPDSQKLVALAPYLFEIAMVCLLAFLSVRRAGWSFSMAAALFSWLYIAPVGDILNAALPYCTAAARNDFAQAFGPGGAISSSLIAFTSVGLGVGGFRIQQRLYRQRALTLPAYLVLAGFAVAFVQLASANVHR